MLDRETVGLRCMLVLLSFRASDLTSLGLSLLSFEMGIIVVIIVVVRIGLKRGSMCKGLSRMLDKKQTLNG